MHNSTEVDGSKEKKFYIRYQQSSLSINKKPKNRYSHTTEALGIRYLASQADAHPLHNNLSESRNQLYLKDISTQRPSHKKSEKIPLRLIGSMMDIFPEGKRHELEQFQINGHKKEEKQFPKIPIQYNDEKVHGCLADFFRLKVIYRGYAPKNTYFFLKSLAISPLEEKPGKRGEYELQFNSRFESGNLAAVAKKSTRQFWLFMREDTNTFGLRQWFYFSIFNRKPGKYKFRIYKYSKFYSLYKEGMKPFIRNNSTETEWKQMGQNVKYETDPDLKCNYLEFEYEFVKAGMKTEFATQPPYTYTMLKEYLKGLIEDNGNVDIRIRKAGESLAGLDIPLIKICQPVPNVRKPAIIMMARTHPSEVASNYALEGFLERLNSLPELKTAYDFYIIPMINPDGVFFGNHRTGVMGQDLNRNFNTNEEEIFPEIKCVQKLIQAVKSSQKIQYLIDLHGHSARRNIFIYGDETEIASYPFAYNHIIPKLLSEQISTFKYNYCVFRKAKNKKNTARVYLSRRYRINALTVEESYGLIDQGAISTRHWRNFGIALADSLLQYYKIYEKGREQGMLQYLKDQIKYQEEMNEKRIKRNLKKLDLQKQAASSERLETTQSYLETSMDLNRKRSKTKQKQEQVEKVKKKMTEISEESINEDELSSGDEDLENNEEGMEFLKKEILKIGCLKDGAKREAFNVAEKKIEIRGFYQPIIHEQRASMMAPRILKFQMKKKEEHPFLNLNRIHQKDQKQHKKPLNITEKSQRDSIELPYLRK